MLKGLNDIRIMMNMVKEMQDPNTSYDRKIQLEEQAKEMATKSMNKLKEKGVREDLSMSQEGIDLLKKMGINTDKIKKK